MKWQFWRTKTNYNAQILAPKVLDIIQRVDTTLAELSVQNDNELVIIERRIGLVDQYRTNESIVMNILSGLDGHCAYYIPRSIAFYVQSDGTWVFLIGIRTDHNPYWDSKALWLDALARTNNARVNIK